MQRAECWLPLGVVLAVAAAASAAEPPPEGLDYFEREVRPILVDSCQKCHGEKKQESDLRLDSRAALLAGGLSGPAIVPGKPEQSLLVAAVRHEGDLRMPPKAKLSEAQIAALTHWIKLGAPWPAERRATAAGDAARTHWAFQPVRDPPVPRVAGNDSSHPLDAFIRERLAREGIPPAGLAPPSDRRALLRRVSYGLTGLPPTVEEVAAFESDADPRAYDKVLDRLLASPHYGEHWGRHWLDVARYSDTKGYVYAREQRFWLHAWVYRDWVVRAFNDDLPYDRFLLLQLAADQVAGEDKAALAAMGFLTLGRRFLGVEREIIDDRIDVVTRGMMGLTVGCARCHDHKYDPIPTRDYYALYGVFRSCSERVAPVAEPAAKDESYAKFEAELNKRRQKLAETLAARRAETAARLRARAGDYLAAQLELHKYPEQGFDQILTKQDLLPTFVRIWKDYLEAARQRKDPLFVAWHAYADLPARDFSRLAAAVTRRLAAGELGEVHPLVAARFATPPASMADVAERYGALFAAQQGEGADPALRALLYGDDGPCVVPDEPIVNIEYHFDSSTCDELWKISNELDQWILQAPPEVRHAAILVDRPRPTTPRVFRRGNPSNLGEAVPRQFVSLLAGPNPRPFAIGSGRLELAQAIVAPENPLTARVLVNRVWYHHFGVGLVPTPSDFGTRAPPPSHPELLDWLAARFVAEGWSLKKLHRLILTSHTYRQSALGPTDPALVAQLLRKDPANRLLWRMNQRRLTFEELRDSLLAVTGRLDPTVGGKAGDLSQASFTRRTLYGLIDRQFLPSTLRVFDFANPDLHTPQRSNTTVPQQALYFLNHPLMVEQARALARRTAPAESPAARIQALYRWSLQRAPTPGQLSAALRFVEEAGREATESAPPQALDWQYGIGAFDEKSGKVQGFTRLPHFTGSAWQGGANWPDGQLGWVQLTADGGHPGNDLAHAAIRRWKAPRDLTVTIRSTLRHDPAEGLGVRGFIVASGKGLLQQASVHHSQADLTVDSLELKAGDTLDFVVDIGSRLSHNQFLWTATIQASDGGAWDSRRDFAGQPTPRLDPWEQLAQVLLSANEFLFLD